MYILKLSRQGIVPLTKRRSAIDLVENLRHLLTIQVFRHPPGLALEADGKDHLAMRGTGHKLEKCIAKVLYAGCTYYTRNRS